MTGDSWVANRAKPCSIGAIDSHRAADRHVLSDHERRFLLTRRVGHLATADSRAIPHVVPVCFTISQGTLYITIDEKPKRVAGPALKRVRNIERNPMVAIVVDRYDEDWTRLGSASPPRNRRSKALKRLNRSKIARQALRCRRRASQLDRSSDGSKGSSRIGSKGVKSVLQVTPSAISSANASPLAGALSMPQTLCPVAT